MILKYSGFDQHYVCMLSLNVTWICCWLTWCLRFVNSLKQWGHLSFFSSFISFEHEIYMKLKSVHLKPSLSIFRCPNLFLVPFLFLFFVPQKKLTTKLALLRFCWLTHSRFLIPPHSPFSWDSTQDPIWLFKAWSLASVQVFLYQIAHSCPD